MVDPGVEGASTPQNDFRLGGRSCSQTRPGTALSRSLMYISNYRQQSSLYTVYIGSKYSLQKTPQREQFDKPHGDLSFLVPVRLNTTTERPLRRLRTFLALMLYAELCLSASCSRFGSDSRSLRTLIFLPRISLFGAEVIIRRSIFGIHLEVF